MGVFAYKGRNGRGDQVEGTLDGEDSSVIADQLMNTGITPTEIIQFRSVLRGASGKPGWIMRRLTEKPTTLMDLMLFSRQMYTLLKAGVPIMRALAGLQESTQNPTFSALLQDLRESLDSGRELSAAMRRHPKVFSPFYVSMVQVGEMTGMLDVTFIRLYEHLEFEHDMRERIKAPRRNDVHCDVVVERLGREPRGEALQRRLAHAVHRAATAAHVLARVDRGMGRNVENPA